MTYIQLINAVLRRLREDEVTAYNESDYSLLIGDFVNEAKREVEDAWDWTALRQDITVTCVASQQDYTLTNATQRYKIFQVLNDTQDTVMQLVPYNYMQRLERLGTTQEASPLYYTINGESSGDPTVSFWPIPDSTDSIVFNIKVSQDDLAASETELTIPDWPVVLGAYAKAISERGEDGSTQYAEAMNNYGRALSDAIAADAVNVPQEIVWKVV